ncbi:MAG: ParB/RepB/Spo0J family partition protein [Candidatus Acidiferrales bacterium]
MEAQPSAAPAQSATTGRAAATAAAPALAPVDGLLHVDIDLIDPSPYQPRSRFREEALDELARSIRASGIVQPLVVRKVGARHQLIAGERRWRAAQRAGLSRVPIVIRNVPDEMALEMTLVENLQREDLNPVEQAHAFQRLIEEFQLTQEEVAERTGKDRTTIANAVRLLKLAEPILTLLEDGKLSSGHGRALLAITDPATRLATAQRIARTGMTVRQVERLATRGLRARAIPSINQPDPNTKAALEELQREYGTRVLIQPRRPGKPGQLIFEYYDDSDLTRLYDQLMLK